MRAVCPQPDRATAFNPPVGVALAPSRNFLPRSPVPEKYVRMTTTYLGIHEYTATIILFPQWITYIVDECARSDLKDIDNPTYTKIITSKHCNQTSPNPSNVEIVNSEQPQKDAKQQCSTFLFV
jgi:hypothetical protein